VTEFVYVVVVSVGGHRTAVALHTTRAAAEHCVTSTLLSSLRESGVSPYSCDYFLVEQWTASGFLTDKNRSTLTSYTTQAVVDRILVPHGHEGENLHEPVRLRNPFERDDLL
jgi:hypothetical protein